MSTRFSPRNKKGFTLIELLIVITIIGILAVALIPRVSQGPAKARDVKRKADINNIATALELYNSDYGSYPLSGSTFTTSAIVCLKNSTVDTTVAYKLSSYIQALPSDPGNATLGGCDAGEYMYYEIYGGTNNTVSSAALLTKMEIATSESDNFYCLSGVPAASDFSTYAATNTFLTGKIKTSTTCPVGTPNTYYVILR